MPGPRQQLRPRTPIQSGGPGGEFGGSQRLYTGRNPFITPNDPGMDFGAPSRYGPPRGRPTMPDREEWAPRRPGYFGPGPHQRDEPIFPNPRRPGIGRPAPEWPYNPRPPGRRPGGPGGRPPGGVGPRSPWDRYDEPRPVPMSSGDFLAGNFGGGLGDQFARNEGAMGMLDEAGLGSFDGDSEIAGLYQTWKKIKAMIGETAANEWLESQQAV